MVDETMRCWGHGSNGELGNGSHQDSELPVNVLGLSTAGGSHACAARVFGDTVCWGAGSSGQLGNGANSGSSSAVTVSGLAGAADIISGNAFSCALKSDGHAFC